MSALCYCRIAHALAAHEVTAVQLDEVIDAAFRAREIIDETLCTETRAALLIELERVGVDSTPYVEARLDSLFCAVEQARQGPDSVGHPGG